MKNKRTKKIITEQELSQSKRDFLKKASLLIGGAALSPLLKRSMFENLARYVVPVAEAQSQVGQIDFVVDIAIKSAFGIPDLLPSPFAKSQQAGRDQFVHLYQPNQIQEFVTDSNRRLFISHDAMSSNGMMGLEPFKDYIAFFECLDNFDGRHNSIWAMRAGGAETYGELNGSCGASLVPLFVNEVANKRIDINKRPKIPGAIISAGNVVESYDIYPKLSEITDVGQFGNAFSTKAWLIGNTEKQTVLETLSRINKIQIENGLRYKVGSIDNANLVSQQGYEILKGTETIAITDIYNSMKSNFMVGPTITGGGGKPVDLGNALLLAYVGFRTNTLAGMSIHLDVNHIHLFSEIANPRNQEDVKYIARRLGAFLNALKTTKHPFREGSLFEYTLITMSSENYKNIKVQPNGWGEGPRGGMAFIGGNVRGGYLGDVTLSGSQAGAPGQTIGFDPNTGAVGGPRVNPSMVARTAAELAGVPANAIQRNMRGANYNAGTINAIKRYG